MSPATVSARDQAEARLAAMGLRALDQTLAGLTRGLFPGRADGEPERVLVHLVGNLGDVVVAVPALMALRARYPKARLTLVSSPGRRGMPGAAHLVDGAPWLDELIVYHQEDIAGRSRQLAFARRLRTLRPDLLVYLPASRAPASTVYRNLLFGRLVGPRRAFGYYVPTFPRFKLAQARVFGRFPQEVDRHLDALAPLGVTRPDAVRFDLAPTPTEDLRWVDALTDRTGGAPIAAFCPGGKQAGHLWPEERFAAVAAVLASRGHHVVTIGGPGDRELGDRLLAATGGGTQAAGELSVLGSAELLRRAALLVTNDTGPMHLAAAVGTPTAAVFSGENFAGRWYPYGEGHEVLRAREVCPTCLFSGTRTQHCVGEITTTAVVDACDRILARSASAPEPGPR